MPAEQQKDGTWRVKKKDGTLGTRKFTTKSNALAAQRGGGAKGKTKPKSRGGGGGGTKATDTKPRKAPMIGATIQGAKATHALTAGAVEVGASQGLPRSRGDVLQAFQSLQKRSGLPYVASLAIEAGSQALDVKFQHATALSKGSVTAWAAELYAATLAFLDARGAGGAQHTVIEANRTLSRVMRAYDPATGQLDVNADFWIYQGAKASGGLARRLSNSSKFVGRIVRPAKRFLSGVFGARM